MSAQINPAFVAKVAQIHSALDGLDYFQLLRVAHDADARAVRAGYHQQSRAFHPDRYHYLNDADLLANLRTIFKRITEAYTVLRDDEKRTKYLERIGGPERERYLRFVEADEQAHSQEERGNLAQTEQGRTFWQKAQDEFSQGKRDAAIQSLKMALVYEQENQHFKRVLAQWQAG